MEKVKLFLVKLFLVKLFLVKLFLVKLCLFAFFGLEVYLYLETQNSIIAGLAAMQFGLAILVKDNI